MNAQVAETFNRATKYVVTHSPKTLTWKNTQWLGEDVVATIETLEKEDGPVLLIQGSSGLLQQLLANDLIDEIRLITYPLVLGRGKRLFGEGAIPAAFKCTKFSAAPNGVIIANYERDGQIKTGSFAMETPTEAEMERRRGLGG